MKRHLTPFLLFTLTTLTTMLSACGDGISDTTSCAVEISRATSGSGVGIRKVSLGSGRVAQSFKVLSDTSITTVQVSLLRIGAAAGTLTMVIESDSGNAPSGAAITMNDGNANSTTLDVSSVSTTEAAFFTFTFSSAIALEANTTYWITVNASYNASDTVYVEWEGTSAGTFSRGEAQTYNQTGSNWSSTSVSGRDLLTKLGCPS